MFATIAPPCCDWFWYGANNLGNSSWGSSSQAQWKIGHESLHSAGLKDQLGPNGYRAYKYGGGEYEKAYDALKETPKADINPDHILDEVF
jgi:hypothetical protein